MELCKEGRMNLKYDTDLQVTTGYRNLSQSRFCHTTPHTNTLIHSATTSATLGEALLTPVPHQGLAQPHTKPAEILLTPSYSITNCSLPHSHFQPQPWSPVTVVTLLTGLANRVLVT